MDSSPAGLITQKSMFAAAETIDRLERSIHEKGIAVFCRVDHSGAAAEAGLPLRFTQLLIFGNPKAGTPLMQSRQTIGIDLPLKFLVWQDERGEVWVSYDDAAYLAERHQLADRPDTVASLKAALDGLARSVVKTPG